MADLLTALAFGAILVFLIVPQTPGNRVDPAGLRHAPAHLGI